MSTKQHKSSMESDNNFGKNRYILWISILVVGIIIGISINTYNSRDPVNEPVSDVFSFETLSIAKQFVCSCGSCGDKELITCTCPTATETKRFIEVSLNNGQSAEEVKDIVKMTYGHYKG